MQLTYKCVRKAGQSFGDGNHRYEVYLQLQREGAVVADGNLNLSNLSAAEAAMFDLDGVITVTIAPTV